MDDLGSMVRANTDVTSGYTCLEDRQSSTFTRSNKLRQSRLCAADSPPEHYLMQPISPASLTDGKLQSPLSKMEYSKTQQYSVML